VRIILYYISTVFEKKLVKFFRGYLFDAPRIYTSFCFLVWEVSIPHTVP